MILKPINNAIHDVLKSSGVVQSSRGIANSNPRRSRAAELLDQAGLSDESAVSELANLAKYGETENIKFNALKTVLEMHGLVSDDDGNRGQINIQIISNGDINLLGILCPSGV